MQMFTSWAMPFYPKTASTTLIPRSRVTGPTWGYFGKTGNQDSDEPQSSSVNVYESKSIETLTIELRLLRPPNTVIKDLEKRLEIQDILINKLQDERKQWRHDRITGKVTTETYCTNGLEFENEKKESCSQETQTEEDESPLKIENLKLHEKNFNLTDEVEELRRQIAVLESSAKLSLAVVRKKVCVDLYSPGGSNIIEGIEDSFRKELQSKLHSKHIDVTYNLIHSHHEQKQLKEPSIVLCPSFSRLGTDVKAVFSAIQDCGRGTVLVVIQYKDEHRLNKVKSEQMLSSEYGHLSAILDMAYFSKKGFYECQFNQNTLDELSTFLINFAG